MQTDEAKHLYARRKEMSEPTFGILKEQLEARRFLLRGLANVRAEFALLATACIFRTKSAGVSEQIGHPNGANQATVTA